MKYRIKRTDLKNKLNAEDALIQAGLDSGWSAMLRSGQAVLEKLSLSEKKYLFDSAVSYFLSGDPVIKYRTQFYNKI